MAFAYLYYFIENLPMLSNQSAVRRHWRMNRLDVGPECTPKPVNLVFAAPKGGLEAISSLLKGLDDDP